MRSLARFVLAGPVQAIAVVFGFALLAFPFPVLIILSGGALVLVGLSFGIRHSTQILLASLLLLYASTYLILKTVTIGPLVTGLSAVLLAYVYRSTRSLNLAMQFLVILGIVIVILAAIFLPNISGHWLISLQNIYEGISKDPALATMLENANFTPERAAKILPIIASIMTGGLVSIYIQTICGALFLGRWWYGLLDKAQPFREEFTELRLGAVLAIVSIICVIGALTIKYAIFWQLAFVCLSMFAIQGLAIVHALLGRLNNPIIGFIVVYGLLFLAAPQMIVALSAFGVMDSFLNFRVRFARSK